MSTPNTRIPSTRGRLANGAPNPVDVHVGARMRLRRTLLGLSQEKLGALIGLTFQQVQKYERGANRIGASRLFDIARVLDVPVSYFFDQIDPATAASSPVAVITGAAVNPLPGADLDGDPMTRRKTIELVRNYYALPTVQQEAMYTMVKAMAAAQHGESDSSAPSTHPQAA